MTQQPTERLQKAIANAGVASRRAAEQLIATGRVTVNDVVVREMGVKVGPHDAIAVDGVPLSHPEHKYFLFYKPRRVVSTVHDDKHRRMVTDFFTDEQVRLYPVGRLDYDTSGLLIMTNDGEFANLLMHPKFRIEKKYVAKVQGIPTRTALAPMRQGMKIDGKKLAPGRYNILSSDKDKRTAVVELTIHQGVNHQVKNMFKALGYPVMKLSRVQYGPLNLDGLTSGDYRALKPREIQALRDLAAGQNKTETRRF